MEKSFINRSMYSSSDNSENWQKLLCSKRKYEIHLLHLVLWENQRPVERTAHRHRQSEDRIGVRGKSETGKVSL